MNEIIKKLTSRKLWMAICGVVVGIAAALGIEASEYGQIAGLITSAVSVVSYVMGESIVDASK